MHVVAVACLLALSWVWCPQTLRAQETVNTGSIAGRVTDAAMKYGKFLRHASVAAIVGGVSYIQQNRALAQSLDILVATPGRLTDHPTRGRLDLSRVEYSSANALVSCGPPFGFTMPSIPLGAYRYRYVEAISVLQTPLARACATHPRASPGCTPRSSPGCTSIPPATYRRSSTRVTTRW